ncbi:MAG: transglutaminase domain-containing protein [Acutalibacteraceae bacterium]
MKTNIKKIIPILLFVLVIAGVITFIILNNNGKKRIFTDDPYDFYEQMAECCIGYEREVVTETGFSPAEFSYDALMIAMKQKDKYLAYNLTGYRYTYQFENGRYISTFKFTYASSKLENFLADCRMRDMCNSMNGLSNYEKVKAVHDYIIKLSRYSYLGTGKGAFWVLYAREPVCMGYALTFYRMMEFCDIPVTYETDSDHAWNKVCLDGYWYNIDLTWDDTGGDTVSYQYFLKSDEDWTGHTHGGATAPTSLQPVGRSADENYKLFPNYRLRFILTIVFILAAVIIFKIVRKRKKERKRVKQAEEEVARMIEQNKQMFSTIQEDDTEQQNKWY